jgi:phospholipase D1/2
VNYGMEHSSNDVSQAAAGATSEDYTDATISPDEYDEDLGLYLDDDTTIVTLGNRNPMIVKRQTQTCSSPSSSDDENSHATVIKPTNELPYSYVYSIPVKFNSFDRKIFIPGTQIHVSITDYERSMTAHLLNPILYTIQLQHGSFTWSIKKRYKDFAALHNSLRMFRASLNFPLPTRAHREIRSSFRADHKASVISTISNSNLNGADEANKKRNVKKKKKKKGSLPRFPKRPDIMLTTDQIPSRIKQMESYLYNLLNITLYRNHHDTINFLEVSNFSFIAALGEKGREMMIKKRTGSTNPGHKKCNLLGCFSLGCCIRCNYICDGCCNQWQGMN